MKTRIPVDTDQVIPLGEFDFTEGRHQLYGQWQIEGSMLRLNITSLPVMALEQQLARYSDVAEEEA